MYFTSDLDLKSSKPSGFTQKAKAKKIGPIGPNKVNIELTLLEIYTCFKRAKHWNNLPQGEQIQLELRWTDLMLELLGIGNCQVMHSIRYRLREQTPDEDEEQES